MKKERQDQAIGFGNVESALAGSRLGEGIAGERTIRPSHSTSGGTPTFTDSSRPAEASTPNDLIAP